MGTPQCSVFLCVEWAFPLMPFSYPSFCVLTFWCPNRMNVYLLGVVLSSAGSEGVIAADLDDEGWGKSPILTGG